MALEERRKIGKLEILENGMIQIQEHIQIFKDGEPVTEPRYHRSVIEPNQELPEGLSTDFDLGKIREGVNTKVVTDRHAEVLRRRKEEDDQRQAAATAQAEADRLARESAQRAEEERIARTIEDKIKDGSIQIPPTPGTGGRT